MTPGSDRTLLLAELAAGPRLVQLLTADVRVEDVWTSPAPGEWSIGEVLRHLAEGDSHTFEPRLTRMLAEDRPHFAAVVPTPGASRDAVALLETFAAARARAVACLKALDDGGWARTGVSPSRGALSVEDYARSMVAHDTEHLHQIHGVREWLGLLPRRCEARLSVPPADVAATIATLPAQLAALAEGLTAAELRQRPAEGEWSMKEVMAHLLKVERDLFLPRLRRIATEALPVLGSFDPDAWAAERDHREGLFADDLAAFTAVRRETVAFLEGVTPAVAGRAGISGYFGPVRLDQYATHILDHDAEHLAQLRACRIVVAGPPRP